MAISRIVRLMGKTSAEDAALASEASASRQARLADRMRQRQEAGSSEGTGGTAANPDKALTDPEAGTASRPYKPRPGTGGRPPRPTQSIYGSRKDYARQWYIDNRDRVLAERVARRKQAGQNDVTEE